MSKLSFRARALDANRSLPVYHAADLPDLSEYNVINRAVPEMPTGMEKEEETEHHLQRAMAAQQLYGEAQQLVIPTPEFQSSIDQYKNIYNQQQTQPRHYLHVNALDVDTEAPDYDLDSEDEEWVNSQSEKQQLTSLKFEEMIDRLEKGSGSQAQHLTLVEAQALLQGNDEDLIVAVFDYWQAKRQRYGHPLLPTVKTEKRDTSSANDHYVAFRRRTERMQTRKNRKNDEASYERMCKLRRDLDRCFQLIGMVKEREEKKRELLKLLMGEFQKRYDLRDWAGEILASVMNQQLRLQDYPPHPAQPHPMQVAAVRRFSQELYNQQQLYQMGVMPQQSYGHPAAPPVSSVLPHNMVASMTVGEVTPTADVNVAMQWQRHAAVAGESRSGRHGEHRSHSSKRKHRGGRHKHSRHDHHQRHYSGPGEFNNGAPQPTAEEAGTDEEALGAVLAAEEPEEEADGLFPFRRRKFVKYHAAREEILGVPWAQSYADIPSSKRYRLYLTSLSRSGEFIGLARRRLGRGGRVWIDRVRWPYGGSKSLEEDIYNGVADWNSIRPDDMDVIHYRLEKPPDAKRRKHPGAQKAWNSFPFVPLDDSWFERNSVNDNKDFFHSSTRVRLKQSTSLRGVVHKSLDPSVDSEEGVAESTTDRNGTDNGQTDHQTDDSSVKTATNTSPKTSVTPRSAAALIASVQGAAQTHSLTDCVSKNENTSDEDMVFEVPSTKPDASVLQLNFPLPADAACVNGSSSIVNLNSVETVMPSKGANLRPMGLSFLARQPNWSLTNPSENGIPSPALVSPVAQLLNDSSPTTHNNSALASVLQVT